MFCWLFITDGNFIEKKKEFLHWMMWVARSQIIIIYYILIVIIHCPHFLSFHWFCLQAKGAGAQIFSFFYDLNSLITILIIIILHLLNFNYVETSRKYIIEEPVVTKLIQISNPVAHYC